MSWQYGVILFIMLMIHTHTHTHNTNTLIPSPLDSPLYPFYSYHQFLRYTYSAPSQYPPIITMRPVKECTIIIIKK
ncbi:hypothetical protein BDC45DRAFT_495524 [Circinella umbellata]|nr:hypothetical protein BDC45DRAFT_495524 [Circinella umbellata]